MTYNVFGRTLNLAHILSDMRIVTAEKRCYVQLGLSFPGGCSIHGNSGMDVSIPGNPRHPGMTLSVPYCSEMTITIVELSATSCLNSTCTIDRLMLMQSLR